MSRNTMRLEVLACDLESRYGEGDAAVAEIKRAIRSTAPDVIRRKRVFAVRPQYKPMRLSRFGIGASTAH